MDEETDPQSQTPAAAEQTLRLTFRATGGGVELINSDRVDMICPPAPGETPRAGEHGGFWMELRGPGDEVLAHRVLSDPVVGSVEVFEPEGTIRREFGMVENVVFEVLLPARSEATSVAFVGEPPGAAVGLSDSPEASAEDPGRARELARFPLPDTEEQS